MSHQAFVDFYQTYLAGPNGADAVARLKAANGKDEYCAVAVEIGRAAGYEFTADEVHAVMTASKAKAEQGSGELSEEQLEGAVGGAIGMTQPTLGTVSIRSLGTGGSLGGLDKGINVQSTLMCQW